MEYLANVLPVDPKSWTLSKATMTKDLIKIEAGGTASTTLTHDQVQFTPKAFKVTVKFLGEFDEFSPAAFAKLLIKDKDKKYQVFTAPFQVTSKTSNAYYMQAELITNVADFNTLIFQFNTEEYVEITEWKLYPSSDIDNNTLNTIESMLPQFLSTFNENAITIGTNETEIVNLPFAMGEAGNLSCHLLFSYVVEASCKMIVTIKVDGSAEPYTPIVMQVQEGPGFVGIPHSFLQVQAAAHLISVTVKLEAYENQPSFNVTGSISLPVTGTFTGKFTDPVEGTTEELSGSLDGTASGNASMTATRSSAGQLKASIQAKAVRYTCEGRGILNGQGGEYPHAEVSETYDEYPIINIGLIQCSTTCEVTTSDYTNIDNIERYTYPIVSLDELGYTADIPIAAVKAFGATEYWVYDSSKADMIHITGNVVLTSTGLTFENGIGEGIVTYDALYPTEDYDPLINCVDFTASGTPNIRFAFSTDGSNWFVTDETNTWQSINLTMSEMSSRGIIPAQLATLDSEVFKALFERGGAKKLTIAVYMVSSYQQTSFTLNNIVVYYSTDESNLPLLAPVITFAIAEDSKARVHWQAPTGQPRAIKLYYGESVDFGQTLQSDVGATFCEVPDLSNRTKYYFAAATLGYGRESELSNVMSVVPTTPVPRFLVCEADISKITLQWQIVGAVYDSYNVYLGTSDDNLVLHTNTTEMQAVLENLQNNVEYFVALTGVKPDEESWFSEIRTARPLLPVLVISDVNTGQTSVMMKLNLPDRYAEYEGYTKYRVYYGTDPEVLTDYIEVTDTNVSVTNLVTDTQYYFYATGLTETEESTPSDVVSAATDSSLKFTTLGHVGRDKPTQADADAQYEQTVEVTSGIQKWIVPETGRYLISATGAAGGKGGGVLTNTACLGGFGAIISGEFNLTAGDELYMLVGNKGTDNMQTSGDATTGAGGGMSVVAIKDDTQTDMLFSTIPVGPLVVAGAGNGGGDAKYSGVAGADALLDEGTNDGYLSNDYSGGGYRQYRNSSYCGKSFLEGGDAATYTYTRSGNSSTAGFGGGGSNLDNGAGGGGAGYRGSYRGASFGGSSYNAGENPTAALNTERTDGIIKIKLIGGTE